MQEYEVEAELLHEFRRHGAQAPAYTPIVAGGANACVLHYVANDRPLNDGDLLLIDAGCELDGYASDITRTFPVNGRFHGPQRDVYELVLQAQAAAIAAGASRAITGSSRTKPPCACSCKGSSISGCVRARVDSVIESGDYRRFYMHRTGHWLGMDVHDCRRLQTRQAMAHAAARHGVDGGARLLHPAGGRRTRAAVEHRRAHRRRCGGHSRTACEVITAAAPKTIADIEALMRQ